jgi:hypothetical protein
MGILSGKSPLAGLLSAEGMEAEDYTNPDRPLLMHPPVEAMTPAAEPGVMAPPIMPGKIGSGWSPRALLTHFYDLKSKQMDITNTAKRLQPRPEDYVIDTDYATPGPRRDATDLSKNYPKYDPKEVLPLNDRARPLITYADQIADAYANEIRQSGIMESDARLFYHVDGPLYRAARKYGLDHDAALKWIDDFAAYVSATSPRTQTEPNTLNALSAMAKIGQGIPHREIVGPGTTRAGGEAGISERGYPMMTGEGAGGIHGNLIDRVISGEGIDPNVNTKPSIFGPNMGGNRSGVTVDTHIIRGIILKLNDLYPGQVPKEWLAGPQALQAYLANPASLRANMISDKLAARQFGPKGKSEKMQIEYPIFADIIHRVADKLGVPQENVADAQAMGWFGMGERTNLGSAPKTMVDLLNERISVTSQMMGVPPQEIARKLFRREIPLASMFPMAVGVGAGMDQQQPAGSPPPSDPTAGPQKMTPEQFQALIDYMRSKGMGPPPRPANPVAILGVRG